MAGDKAELESTIAAVVEESRRLREQSLRMRKRLGEVVDEHMVMRAATRRALQTMTSRAKGQQPVDGSTDSPDTPV